MGKYRYELYHHGIKGQKWGIRRFQNEDGSYTAAGKERYGKQEKSAILKEGEEYYNSQLEKYRIKADRELKKIDDQYERFVNGEMSEKEEKALYKKYAKYDLHGVGDLNSADLWTNLYTDYDISHPRGGGAYKRKAKEDTKKYIESKYDINYDDLLKRDDRKTQMQIGALTTGIVAAEMGIVLLLMKKGLI